MDLQLLKTYDGLYKGLSQRFLNWDIAVWDKTTHGKQNTCKNCSLLLFEKWNIMQCFNLPKRKQHKLQ